MEQEINVIQERQEQEINVLQEQQERSIPILPENITIGGTAELFYVIFNETLTHADKTSTEIYQALQDGLYPIGVYYYNNEYYVTPFIDITATNAVAQVMIDNYVNNVSVDNQGNAVQNTTSMARTSDLSQFITRSVNNLLYYYTTSETYNKSEIDNIISSISAVSFEVVEEKPTFPHTNIIYLIPKNPGEQDNIYDEWIYVNNNWELIGTTEIDLSNYYTKAEVDSKLYYDASYLFTDNPISTTQYNELVSAITNKTRIVLQQGTEQYDALGRINNGGDLMFTITVGTTASYDGNDYAYDIVAKFEIDGTTKEVIQTVGATNGADIAQALDTLNTEVSNKVDANTNSLTNYYTKPINNSLGGIMMPDTTNMTPIKTIEYNLSSNAYFKFMSIANTFTNFDDVAGECLFRITTTGASVNITECYFSLRQSSNFMPFMIVRNRPGAGVLLAANTGLRYIRYAYPKALNSGYDWDLEFNAINNNARHIKIEVFSSSSNITWYESLTPSTLNTTNQTSSTITLSTSDSLNLVGTFNMTASTATSAQYLTSYLQKFLSGTLPKAGQAILTQQFIYFSDDGLAYPSSNKTKPIRTGVGLQLSSNAVNLNSAVPNSGLRQKYNNATLTNIPHATLKAGDDCWFRCTIDANGNIYSDDYVDTERKPGYTWYHIGMATSETAINTDTTQSTFYTLDANGKLTHIDGLEIA